MHIVQHGCLARALKIMFIHVCCIQETCIQDISSLIRLTSSPFVKIRLSIAEDHEATASGVPGADVVLSGRIQAALPYSIPVDIWLCAVRQRFVRTE